jgi:hypothetical protein
MFQLVSLKPLDSKSLQLLRIQVIPSLKLASSLKRKKRGRLIRKENTLKPLKKKRKLNKNL